MKMGFTGQVNTEDMRLFFHKTAQSTVENETPEELEMRFNSILSECAMELISNENSS